MQYLKKLTRRKLNKLPQKNKSNLHRLRLNGPGKIKLKNLPLMNFPGIGIQSSTKLKPPPKPILMLLTHQIHKRLYKSLKMIMKRKQKAKVGSTQKI